MKRISALLLGMLFVGVLLSSCATTQSLAVEKRSRVYTADYFTVFRAAVDYCNDRGFPIIMVDKDLGIINTGPKENEGVSKFLVGHLRSSFNLSIRERTNGTVVIAILSCEQQGLFGRWTQMTMISSEAENAYKRVFDGIESFIPKTGIIEEGAAE